MLALPADEVRMRVLPAVVAALLATFAATPLRAEPLLFDSRVAWDAFVGTSMTETFAGAVGPDAFRGQEQQYYDGIERPWLSATVDYADRDELIAANPIIPGLAYPREGTFLVWQNGADRDPPTLYIDLDTPTSAIGFDYGSIRNGPNQITATLFGSRNTYTIPFWTTVNASAFWGVSLPNEYFRSLALTVTYATPNVDGAAAAELTNVSVAAPVPEPATMLLVGTGTAAAFARRRWRRRVER
jgi:hypothetical protein